jgi:multidrug efflux pump subunit AcrB
MGKYLGYIPITVFITLLASLFLTLTITSPIFWKLSKNLDYYRKDEKEEQALNDDARSLLEIEREGKREKI